MFNRIVSKIKIMLDQFDQLHADPEILGGKPCLRGTRISVDMILEWFATGATIPTLLEQYPHLTEAGIQQALQYAAQLLRNETIIEVKVA